MPRLVRFVLFACAAISGACGAVPPSTSTASSIPRASVRAPVRARPASFERSHPNESAQRTTR